MLKTTNPLLSIRNATVEDIGLIRELTFKIWPQTYAAIISQQQIDYMLGLMYSEASLKDQMTKDGCQFILVYDEKEPVGFAAYQEIRSTTWKLHKIYILATQQGKGTGKFVIHHILDKIQQRGATALQLQVNRHNKARNFYEKIGFTVIEEADFDIGNGYFMNDYVMEKKF
jgi:ribosomal protein S18 acetylase RimI-like enzyme